MTLITCLWCNAEFPALWVLKWQWAYKYVGSPYRAVRDYLEEVRVVPALCEECRKVTPRKGTVGVA